MPSQYGDKNKGKNEFREHLKSLLHQYQEWLSLLDIKEQPRNWNDTLNSVHNISECIIEVIDLVYSGLHSRAHKKFRDSICINELLRPRSFEANTSWYRMRKFEENKKQAISRKDMFHIPLNKRGIVKTQRYSSPGYPCLYLGASIYTCWEELHRPDLNRCFASLLHNTKRIKLIDITYPIKSNWKYVDFEIKKGDLNKDIDKFPDEQANQMKPYQNHFPEDESDLSSILKTKASEIEKSTAGVKKHLDLDQDVNTNQDVNSSSSKLDTDFIDEVTRIPLILASMVKVKNVDDVFKPEYIIPQQIMESVIEMINDENSDDGIIGIYYTSVHNTSEHNTSEQKYDDFIFSFSNYTTEIIYQNNIAIPIQNPNSKEFCDELRTLFKITNPTCEEFERAKRVFEAWTKQSYEDNKNKQQQQYEYDDSVFHQLEIRLNNHTLFPLEIIPSDEGAGEEAVNGPGEEDVEGKDKADGQETVAADGKKGVSNHVGDIGGANVGE